MMTGFYSRLELERSHHHVSIHDLALVDLVDEANSLMTGEWRFGLFAYDVWEMHWWYGPRISHVHIELLFGKMDGNDLNLQVVVVEPGDYKTYLRGFCDGINIDIHK